MGENSLLRKRNAVALNEKNVTRSASSGSRGRKRSKSGRHFELVLVMTVVCNSVVTVLQKIVTVTVFAYGNV